MSQTASAILSELEDAYLEIAQGRSEEYERMDHRQRMLKLRELREEIQYWELAAARESGTPVIKPIRTVDV